MGPWLLPRPQKKIVFRCGGEAAATKNIFFLFF
jgi:hypothetical protein